MPQVQIIQPIQPQTRRLRVAAYARVSSDSADQLNSMSTQVDYYTHLIQDNPQWEFAGVYADEGISGTGTRKREQFNRLMEDCRIGLIDRVLVKSASRFARNTADALASVRELKSLGVTVAFEKEGFDTETANGEMLLSMICAVAQEESLSISKNMKWGIRKKMQAGTYMNRAVPFGYCRQNHQLVPSQDEAAVVSAIFKNYLNGMGIEAIARQLNETNPKQKGLWYYSAVWFILHNEAYTGTTLYQKHYTSESLPFRVHHNNGQLPQYCISDAHEAIVSKEDFNKVQVLLKKKQMSKPHMRQSVFTKKMCCAECGTVFARTHRGSNAVVWGCRKHLNKAELCPVKSVYETELCRAFLILYSKLQANREKILQPVLEDLSELKYQQEQNSAERSGVNEEIQRLAKQKHNLARIRTLGYLDDVQYLERKAVIEQQLQEKKALLTRKPCSGKVEKALQCTRKLAALLETRETMTTFDDTVFAALVHKVRISNATFEFEMINGMKLTERRTEK